MTISIPKPKVFLLCNVVSLLVGLTVLFGWHTHQPSLIQIHESWVPMQYNTALGFFFCGLAGILILYSQYSIKRFVVLIPILLGGLTLIEYASDMDLLIDEMFMKHFITTKTSHPGRMAPNTALCFLLSGISLGLTKVSSISRSRKLILVSMMGGLLVTTLSFTALIGYLVDLEEFYGWGSLTRMAIHTSFGFIFLGVGLVANATERNKAEKSVLVFAVLILLAISLVLSVLTIMKHRTQKEVANTLQLSLNRTLSELSFWADDIKRDNLAISQLPGIDENIIELLKVPKNAKRLLASSSAKKIDDILRPFMKSHSYEGYIVIAPDDTNIASMLKLNVGDKNLLVGVGDYLHRAFKGDIIITPPQKTDIPLKNFSGRISIDTPTMFSLVPIFGENEEIIAVLSFRLSPHKSFTPIFELGIFGETGETYAFNKDGLMVSKSRFNKLFVQLKLIPPDATSVLNLQVRDPGGNLIKGFTTPVSRENQPFTEMAISALRGERKMNVSGYRDYRGILVAGSWAWVEKLGIGVVAEIDLEETYASFNFFRKLILILLFSMVVLFTMYTLQLGKRRKLLIEAEERFSEIVKTAVDGIIVISIKGVIKLFNPAAEKLFSYSAIEVMGSNVSVLMPDPHKSDHDQYLKNYLQTGNAKIIGIGREMVAVKKDGSLFDIDLAVSEMNWGGEKTFLGFVKDISRRKQVEKELAKHKDHLEELVFTRTEKLKQSEGQIRLITDSLSVLISYVDSDLYYRFNNVTYEKWFDRPLSEITGKRVQEVLGELAYQGLEGYFKTVLAGQEVNYEKKIPYKYGGERSIYAHHFPDFDKHGKVVGFFSLIQDVTERKQMEEKLAESQKQVVHNDKLASLGRLTGSIAHEFNNPLQGIRNIMEILVGSNLTAEEMKLVALGRKECDRMAEMVRGLGSFYKPSSGKFSSISINNSIEEVLALQTKSLKLKDIQVKRQFSDGLPMVKVAEDQIKQVLLNLIQNASDSLSENGGTITLTTEKQGSQIAIKVQDTGSGILADEIKSIFEPFYTTKGTKGTGLGLSISYGIIKDHGGNIIVASEQGIGSTFTVTLPIHTSYTSMDSEEA